MYLGQFSLKGFQFRLVTLPRLGLLSLQPFQFRLVTLAHVCLLSRQHFQFRLIAFTDLLGFGLVPSFCFREALTQLLNFSALFWDESLKPADRSRKQIRFPRFRNLRSLRYLPFAPFSR